VPKGLLTTGAGGSKVRSAVRVWIPIPKLLRLNILRAGSMSRPVAEYQVCADQDLLA